jgi:intracellular septation protein A
MATLTERIAAAKGFLRQRGVGIALEVLFNFVLPFLIYSFSKARLGDVHALMASSASPIAWSIVEFIRRRRVDALSMLVLAGIALSLLAYLGGGSVRFLQLREKMVTALIGLVFLGSAAIGKPLIYQLARATIMRRSPDQLQSFEAMRDNAFFRRTMMVMTLVWGGGLLAEAAVASTLVFVLSISQFLVVGPILGYGTAGALSLWTFWYRGLQMRRGAARRAAAEAAAANAVQAAAATPS